MQFALTDFTVLTSGTDADGGSTATTASVSPAANALLLLCISQNNTGSAVPTTPTATGNGLTWVSEDGIEFDTGNPTRKRISVLRAQGESPTTGTIALDFGGQNQSVITWMLVQCARADTSSANGAGAVIQSVTAKDETGSATTLTVTLAAFGNADNATLGFFTANNPTLNSRVVGSGFTEIGYYGSGTDLAIVCEGKITNDTSVDLNYGQTGLLGGVAVELKAVTGSTVIKQMLMNH